MVGTERNQNSKRENNMKVEIRQVGTDWVGFVNGEQKAKSYSKGYVEKRLEDMTGLHRDEFINRNSVVSINAVTEPEVEKFDINTRFMFIEKVVAMVANGVSASALVCGDGGLGKTYTVKKVLDGLGFKDISGMAKVKAKDSDDDDDEDEESDEEVPEPVVLDDNCYLQIKGYSTAKGLYRSLFENNGKVLVFDDCDSVLEDKTAKLILKGALDSYDKRIISWNSEMSEDDDLPRSFEFTGQVIFITNKKLSSIDQAIRTRALKVDVSMTLDQKIDRMGFISSSPEFLPEYTKAQKNDALEFIRKFKNEASEVSLRTLIEITKIRATAGSDWEPFAEYMLTH